MTLAEIEIAVQVLGKVKSLIVIPVKATEAQVLEMALADEKTVAAMRGKPICKFIYIPGRTVNIVI
jgi:leucyl-tRNA synthetase